MKEALTWLQVLPLITTLFAICTGVFTLYIANKFSRFREIIRDEFEKKMSALETATVSKEQLEFAKTELKGLLKTIEMKIDFAAEKQELIDRLRDMGDQKRDKGDLIRDFKDKERDK